MLAQQVQGSAASWQLLRSSPSLNSNDTWASVEQLLSLVYALVQTVTLAAPGVQDLVSSCIHELSQIGPKSDNWTLLSSHKLVTALGLLLSQLNTMQQQQQQQSPALLPTHMLQHMLVNNLTNDLRRSLLELQAVRKGSNGPVDAVQPKARRPMQPSQQQQQPQLHSITPDSNLTPSVATKGFAMLAQSLQSPLMEPVGDTYLNQQQARTPPWTTDIYARHADDKNPPLDQDVQAHLGPEFADYYKLWDVPDLRLDALPTMQSLTAPSSALEDACRRPCLADEVAADNGAQGSVPVMPLNVVDGSELIKSELLGAGSFGSVHSGMWMGAPVAIKYLHSSSNGKTALTGDVHQLRKEVLLQAKCSHPNVVKFYAMCYNPPAIVMELCSGRSLADGLKAAAAAQRKNNHSSSSKRSTRQLLLAQTRIELLRHAASAVTCMHNQAALLHNDLRAANMLLDNTATGWSLKVADFGLAVELKAGSCCALVKQTTNPLWVAPEVLHGASSEHYEVTKASDVYSLGCVTYECLTGRIPLWDNTDTVTPDVRAMQVHLAASTGSPVQLQYPFKEALLSCPETGHERAAALKPLFERCCSCNPEDRPPVWQVHQCLQHALLMPVVHNPQRTGAVARSPLEHPDLLACILQRLPLRTRLGSAALVNKQFAAAAYKATSELHIKDLSMIALKQLQRWFSRAGAGHITSLVLDHSTVEDVLHAWARVPWSQLSSLQTLSLPLVSDHMLEVIDWRQLACTGLTSLQLRGFSTPGKALAKQPLALMSQLSNLRQLDVDADYTGFAKQLLHEAYMPHLAALTLKFVSDDTDVVAVGRHTRLQRLQLTLGTKIQVASLQGLVALTRLQDLSLRNLDSTASAAAAAALVTRSFSNLTSLDLSQGVGSSRQTYNLSNVIAVTELVGLQCLLLGNLYTDISPVFLSSLTALTRLDATAWRLPTASASESLLHAAGCLTGLRHFSLKDTELHRETAPVAMLLFRHHHHLTYLNLRGVMANLDANEVLSVLGPTLVNRSLSLPCLQYMMMTPPKSSWLLTSPNHVAGIAAACPSLVYFDMRDCLTKEALQGLEGLSALTALTYLCLGPPKHQLPPAAKTVMDEVADRRLKQKLVQ